MVHAQNIHFEQETQNVNRVEKLREHVDEILHNKNNDRDR